MYLAAAFCLWYLKAWKIGQLEKLAATTNEPLEIINPTEVDVHGVQEISPFVRRLFRWQKV